MPNVEIHGFTKETAELWKKAIIKVTKNKPLFQDMVITIYPTLTTTATGEDAPFLRIVSTEPSLTELSDLLEESLGIDIEELNLCRFKEGHLFFPSPNRHSPPKVI